MIDLDRLFSFIENMIYSAVPSDVSVKLLLSGFLITPRNYVVTFDVYSRLLLFILTEVSGVHYLKQGVALKTLTTLSLCILCCPCKRRVRDAIFFFFNKGVY